MSILTHKEREALEEVFLSINSRKRKYKRFKFYLLLFTSASWKNLRKKSSKSATAGNFQAKLTKFFPHFQKDKKNLSE